MRRISLILFLIFSYFFIISRPIYAQGTFHCIWTSNGCVIAEDDICDPGCYPETNSCLGIPEVECTTDLHYECNCRGFEWQAQYNAIQTLPGAFTFNTNTTLGEILNALVSYIFPIVGLLLLVFLIIGGFKFMTSGGDPKQAQSAKSTITAAILGLAIVFLAFWVVQIVAIIFDIGRIQSVF